MSCLAVRATLVALLLVPGAASAAETASSKSRMLIFESQTRVLDGRAAVQYSNSSRLLPPSLNIPGREGIPGFSGRYRGEWLAVARSAARRYNVPEDLFLRLVQQESGWNPRAVSHKGATDRKSVV